MSKQGSEREAKMVAIKHDITLTELLNRALRKELEATKNE